MLLVSAVVLAASWLAEDWEAVFELAVLEDELEGVLVPLVELFELWLEELADDCALSIELEPSIRCELELVSS